MLPDIDRFYQQCDPTQPLPSGDGRYVSLRDVRGTGDLVERVSRAIRRSPEPAHLLFAGHRGGGKSTELQRLEKMLSRPRDGSKPFFVVYYEADEEDIDVNDVDFPDVLLSMVRHVGKALREQKGIELRPARLSRFFEDIRDLLGSEVKLESLGLDARIAKFTAAIKSSPNARKKIRDALEPNVSSLIREVNNFMQDATVALRGDYRDLVIIVDNLDRIVLRTVGSSEYNTHEQLFINRGTQLAEVGCHVVYTIPITLVHSPKATALQTVFGRGSAVLPSVRVVDRDGRDAAGLEAMCEMVRKRLHQAQVDAKDAFDDDETLRALCRASGGHPRNLMILLRAACDWLDDLPITRNAADQAIRGLATDFERALNNPKYYDALRHVLQTHELPGTPHDQLLLYNLSVLEYLNGDSWYVVNPAVKLLSKLTTASTPAEQAKG